MALTKVREKFHRLIDKIEDENFLVAYYRLIDLQFQHKEGSLWHSLSEQEKQELLLADDESNDPANLISHQKMTRKHKKWLKK